MNFTISVILVAFGALGGWWLTTNHFEAKQLEAERVAVATYRAAVARGNTSSAKLAKAETTIQIKTVERIKYVPQVTTGRRCLDPDAVSLLNGSGIPRLSAAARQPAAADAAAPAASDSDVAAWIVIANGQYEICAARVNGLVDHEEGKQ